MDAFCSGFYDVIPKDVLRAVEFSESELELLFCGLPDIDVSDWYEHTSYGGGYVILSPQIGWFWRVVKSLGMEERAKLLQFCTGSAKVPPGGFSNLKGSTGPQKFTIIRHGKPESLPVSHTCFNRLDLPAYPSYEVLRNKLIIAITYGASAFALQ